MLKHYNQFVDYPRCRIYRQFVQSIIQDRSIRTNGGSGLFYYTVLCTYTNFRTSYQRIGNIRYTVSPGQWICSLTELRKLFRVSRPPTAVAILDMLQSKKVITYELLADGKAVKYKICNWKFHNSMLDNKCPSQKTSGFFFLPLSTAWKLMKGSRCSEADMYIDLWLSAIYNDPRVIGSDIGPIVYLRNGTSNPLLNCTQLAQRWGVSRATVSRVLSHFVALQHIEMISFAGNAGSVIYLTNYLETMFQMPRASIDKMKVSQSFQLRISDKYDYQNQQVPTVSPQDTPVSDWNNGVEWFELMDSQTYQVFRVSSLP